MPLFFSVKLKLFDERIRFGGPIQYAGKYSKTSNGDVAGGDVHAVVDDQRLGIVHLAQEFGTV